MLRPRSRPSTLPVAVAVAAGLLAVGPSLAPASAADPAGDNGTVKIAPDGELDAIPRNHPHQGCAFQVEWYGFDEGEDIVSTVEFAMQAPTADVVLSGDDPSTVPVGGDAASGAGTESGPDAVQAYTLSFDGAPHPRQGYHVKLTVHTPGSIGADTKHKVFWVTGCEESTPEESTGTTSTLPTDGTGTTGATATSGATVSSGTTGTAGATGSTAPTAPTSAESTLPGGDESTAGSQATSSAAPVPSAGSATDDVEVAGEQAAAPAGADVPSAVDAGEQGPVARITGSRDGLLVAGAGLLLGLGAFLVRRRRA